LCCLNPIVNYIQFLLFVQKLGYDTTIQEIITATQPTTIKMMAASLFLHSVVINFALTIEKQEQQQPILLQSTTPEHEH